MHDTCQPSMHAKYAFHNGFLAQMPEDRVEIHVLCACAVSVSSTESGHELGRKYWRKTLTTRNCWLGATLATFHWPVHSTYTTRRASVRPQRTGNSERVAQVFMTNISGTCFWVRSVHLRKSGSCARKSLFDCNIKPTSQREISVGNHLVLAVATFTGSSSRDRSLCVSDTI